MDAATNITTAASEATLGEAGEEVRSGDAGRREPVSGQMGNVAAGEPYDNGNLGVIPTIASHMFPGDIQADMHMTETQRHDTAPTSRIADSKATNGAAAEQAGAAATRKKSLYSPVLPVGPAENGSTGATAISTDSRNPGEQKSPIVQGVGEPERASGSGTGQQNGLTYDESKCSFFRY
jgi:hypothetical protein